MFGIGRGRGRGNLGRLSIQDGEKASPFMSPVQPSERTLNSQIGKYVTATQTLQSPSNEVIYKERDQHATPVQNEIFSNGRSGKELSVDSQYNQTLTPTSSYTPIMPPPGLSSIVISPMDFKPLPSFYHSSTVNPLNFLGTTFPNVETDATVNYTQLPAKPVPHLFSPDEFTKGIKCDERTSKENIENKEKSEEPKKKGVYLPPQMRQMIEEKEDINKQQKETRKSSERNVDGPSLVLPLGRGMTPPERQHVQKESSPGTQIEWRHRAEHNDRQKVYDGKHQQQKKPLQWHKEQRESRQGKQRLQQTSTGHHYSQKPLLSEEGVIKAELEWKKWKLQHSVKRLFNKNTPEEMKEIPEELKICLLKNKLSSDFPGLSDVQLLMEVVFDHILDKPSSIEIGVIIVKTIHVLEKDTFNTHFTSIFTTHRDGLLQDHGVSDISSRVKGFCFFTSLLYQVANSEDLDFKDLIKGLVKMSLEKWLKMFKTAKLSNPTQFKVLSECFYYLFRLVGKDLEQTDRSLVLQCIESSKECVLSDNLPRSCRSLLLDLLLACAGGWPELNLEEEMIEEKDSDVIIEDESLADASDNQANNEQDPYFQVKKMLSKLNLENMLDKFESNCIRDSLLSADKDDLKSTLQEAGFPPGVVLEMQMYLDKQKLNNQDHVKNGKSHSNSRSNHVATGSSHKLGKVNKDQETVLPWRQRPPTETSEYKPPKDQFPTLAEASKISQSHIDHDIPKDKFSTLSETSKTSPKQVDCNVSGDEFPTLSEATKFSLKQDDHNVSLDDSTTSEISSDRGGYSSGQGGWSTDSEGSDVDLIIEPELYHPPPPPPVTQPFGTNKPKCCTCGSEEHRTWQCKNREKDFGF